MYSSSMYVTGKQNTTKVNVTFINILELILSLINYRLQQFDNKYLDNQTRLNGLFVFLRISLLECKIYSS